jgi:hypothetical protein
VTNLKKAAAILTICFFACHFLAIRPPVADVDRSGAADLVDAIMAVQGLHRLSQDLADQETGGAGEFRLHLLNAVEAFKVLAGMKTFSPVKPSKAVPSSASFVALIPTQSVDYDLPMTLIPETTSPIYHSYEPEPSTPPPRA